MSTSTSHTITLRGLLLARWMLCAVVAVGLGLAVAGRVPMDWSPSGAAMVAYGALLAGWAGLNGAEHVLLRLGRPASPAWSGVHLLVDIAALTGFLALSGGTANPFTMLYVVPLTLAIAVSPAWTWVMAAASLFSFGVLFLVEPENVHANHAGHGGDFGAHLRGMWVAYGVTGALVTYAVQWIAQRTNRDRRELAELQERRLAERQLAQVGSLAAGAAHELGTPLATLSLLSGDLDRMSPEELEETSAAMRRELDRCKLILQRMAAPELRASSREDLEPWSLQELADEVGGEGIEVQVHDPSGVRVDVPKGSVAQVVRELVSNARTASGPSGGVRVRMQRRGAEAIVEVEDDGPGMTPEVRQAAFDPFFSTKPEGSGMGLGLFVARAQTQLLQGRLELAAAPGGGTLATLTVPIPSAGRAS